MLDWIGRLRHSLASDRFEPAYRTKMLRLILPSMTIMTVVSFVVYMLVKPVYLPSVIAHVGILLACVVAWYAMRRGWVLQAGYVLCGALWLIVNLSAFFYDGIDGAAFAVNVLVLFSAGLLLGERGVLIFVALTLVVGWACF